MLSAAFRFFTEPWVTGRLDEAREAFRSGRLSEWDFRVKLTELGYTRYGVDAEVRDQVTLISVS